MHGIKPIAEILKRLALVPLSAAVKPDGEQSQQCEALLQEEERFAENRQLIAETAQQLAVDVPEKDQLRRSLPPAAAAEEIEDQHSEDACVIKIHKGQKSCRAAEDDACHAYGDLLPKDSACLCPLIPMDQPNGNEEAPKHVLMNGVEQTAAEGKVKGDLGEKREQQQTLHIFFEVFRVEISLYQQKSEEGKGQAADAGQPVVPRHNGAPKMVAQHEDHGHDVERGRGGFDFACLFRRDPSPIKNTWIIPCQFDGGKSEKVTGRREETIKLPCCA